MVAWSRHDFPKVGLVGVMTNAAPPPQLAEPGYDTLAGLDAFAAAWQETHYAEAVRVPRLTGFCLLVRAEVFRRAVHSLAHEAGVELEGIA